MIDTATHYISMLNTNYVEPTIDWSKNHKMVISTLGISILLGAVCYTSPQAFDIMKKNVKFLTIVAPIAYTLPAPIIGICMAITEAGIGRGVSYNGGKMFDAYCESIIKVWQAWFRFVGISA